MKKGKIIDLTTKRKGSKPFGVTIDICPKCKLKGEKEGNHFVHKKEYRGVILGGILFIPIDFCFIDREK